jgi:cytochrome d ubiquinol oxidase subunit II
MGKARNVVKWSLVLVAMAMALVSILILFVGDRIPDCWVSLPNVYLSLPIPLLAAIAFVILWRNFVNDVDEAQPFLLLWALFLLGYMGFTISHYP